jgi:hypothetical protein
MKDVEEEPGKRDGFFGAAEENFTLLEHQGVNDRGQAIDVVGVNMGQEDNPDTAGVELELFDFLDGAARAVDKNKIFDVAQKERRVISRRSGDRSSRS